MTSSEETCAAGAPEGSAPHPGPRPDHGLDVLVQWRDAEGQTLAHLAASHGALGLLQWWTGRGLPVDVRDFRGRTPVHVAAACDRADVLRDDTLGVTADMLNASDAMGWRAVHCAAAAGAKNAWEALIDHPGVDTDAVNAEGYTALQLAARFNQAGIVRAFASPMPGVAQRRAALLARLAAQLYQGESAVHIAACRGHADVVRAFHERGHRVDLPSAIGDTPLDLAAMYGRVNVTRLLRQVETARRDGRPPNADGMEPPPPAPQRRRYARRISG